MARVTKIVCDRCGKKYPSDAIYTSKEAVPRCSCGGVIRPDIVLYEEPLDQDIMEEAVHYIRNADVLIIGGGDGGSFIQPTYCSNAKLSSSLKLVFYNEAKQAVIRGKTIKAVAFIIRL